MAKKILVINPGSTSTKVAVYEDENVLFEKTLRHSTEEIQKFDSIPAQRDWRKDIIDEFLKENNFDVKELDAVVGRGGLVKPVEGGTYTVNDALEKDLTAGVAGQHASNLGGLISKEIATPLGIPSFIVDPTTVDELEPLARYTGNPEFPKTVIWHALNQKAVARRYAAEIGSRYEDLNLIICHLGGGLSIGAHRKGKCIEVNNSLDGNGPFSPERSGDLPSGQLVKMCYSGKYTQDEMYKKICGKGGFTAYYGTNDARAIEDDMAAGKAEARELYDAYCYGIAKEVGALSTVLKGEVDAVLVTGGIAYSKYVIEQIAERVSWIAPVKQYGGEDEMLALTQGVLRVLNGEEAAKEYK